MQDIVVHIVGAAVTMTELMLEDLQEGDAHLTLP